MVSKLARAALGLVLVAALVGCSAPPPQTQAGVKIVDVSLGRSVAADKTIADKTESFVPADTIYVSIKTEGAAPSATLTARWTYEGGQVVNESNQTIAPGAAEVTEFHVSKPDGWPAGGYKVEVLLNGTSGGTKAFKVM